MLVASFHFPLHRYLAAFTCQAVKCMGMSLKNILPSTNLLTLLMIHPLRVQVSVETSISEIIEHPSSAKISMRSTIHFIYLHLLLSNDFKMWLLLFLILLSI